MPSCHKRRNFFQVQRIQSPFKAKDVLAINDYISSTFCISGYSLGHTYTGRLGWEVLQMSNAEFCSGTRKNKRFLNVLPWNVVNYLIDFTVLNTKARIYWLWKKGAVKLQPSTCSSFTPRRYVFYDFRANEKGQFELSNWVLWLPPPKCEIMLCRIMGTFQGLPQPPFYFFGDYCIIQRREKIAK